MLNNKHKNKINMIKNKTKKIQVIKIINKFGFKKLLIYKKSINNL